MSISDVEYSACCRLRNALKKPLTTGRLMLLTVRKLAFKPFLILLYSFLVGLAIDAVAERLSAQELSSRKITYSKKRIQEEAEKRSADAKVQESDPSDLSFDLDNESNSDTGSRESRRRQVGSGPMDGSELSTPIMDIQLNVNEMSDRVPEDQSNKLLEMNYSSNYPGTFQNRVAMWCPPNIRYQPLFFEDVGLERYGYHAGDRYQPVVSALHFAKSFTFLLPNMRHEHPYDCTYPLGFCRPGSTAPQIENRWLR